MVRNGPVVTHSLCFHGFHGTLTRLGQGEGRRFHGVISHVLSLMPSNLRLGELVSRSERLKREEVTRVLGEREIENYC